MRTKYILTLIALAMPVISGVASAAATVISKKTAWHGNIEIKAPMRFTYTAPLIIKPGTKVSFSENGQLICEGAVDADGAEFSADKEMVGEFRINFMGKYANLKNCSFTNMVSVKKRYHNAFMRIYKSPSTFSGNTFKNCSAIEFTRCKNPVVKNNTFEKPHDTGLAIFHSEKALIKQNIFSGGSKTSCLIKLNTAKNCRVVANRFFDKGRGILFYGKSEENQIKANSFFRNSVGIDFRSGGRGKNLILGCIFFRAKWNAILFRGGTDEIIRNCVLWNSGSAGINVITTNESSKDQHTLSIVNNAICSANIGIHVKNDKVKLECSHNVLWENKTDFTGIDEENFKDTNIFTDPMFVNPDEGNFRLQAKTFGYESDSPLIKAGTPEDTNIGVFP